MDDFMDAMIKEQQILAQGLAESRRAKQERSDIAKQRRAKRMRSHRSKRKGRRDRSGSTGKRESVGWSRV